MAVYTFDKGFNTIQTLTSNLSTAQAAATNTSTGVKLMQVYGQGMVTSSTYNNDTDTDFDNAFTKINTAMPNPGSGTNTAGDTPQEVLFLVTDGANDSKPAKVNGACPSVPLSSQGTTQGGDSSWSYNQNGISASGCRQQSVINANTDWCTTIRNRGIRIAVLYTVYNPITANPWYNTYWAPIQSDIEKQLKACASSGLFSEVQTDGDITAALDHLFDIAVQSAYLAK
jgi:hypothetical protein